MSVRTCFKNKILAALPETEIRNLVPHLSPVVLNAREILADGAPRFGYFLEEGLASVVITLPRGEEVEVAAVGSEGVVGVSLLLGVHEAPGRTSMQVNGLGFSVPAEHLRKAFENPSELQTRLQRYLQGFIVQMAQNSACNRHHQIIQRLARWLLTCHDRVQNDRMPLTHDVLGCVLGAPRATVTLAAGKLLRAGLIEYTRGHLTITDRAGLENAACDCYRIVRDEFRHLESLPAQPVGLDI